MALVLKARDSPSYIPPHTEEETCETSVKCSKFPIRKSEVVSLQSHVCNGMDLDCICSHDSSMSDNKYFDSHCIFEECSGTEARKEFIKAFLEACTRSNQAVLRIPAEWEPFLPAELPKSTLQTPTTTKSTDSARASSTSSAKLSSITSSAVVTTTYTTSVQLSTTASWSDIQKPTCSITERCLVNKNTKNLCILEDLQCVCKYSNSIANSTYFLPDCLYAECYSDYARSGWMDAFAYACVAVNKSLIDINDQWKPYIPVWYLNRPISNTPLFTAIAASNSATAITSNINSHLSEGAVASVAVVGVLACGVMTICGILYWRARKRLKRKYRENAEMADALQRNGVTQRIDQLNYGRLSYGDVGPPPAKDDVYGLYKPQPNGKHFPGSSINTLPSQSQTSLGTKAIATNLYPYQHHKSPAEYDRGSSACNCLSRTPRTYTSQNILLTNAITTIPSQEDSANPYRIHTPSIEHVRNVDRRSTHRTSPRASSDSLGTTVVPKSPGQHYSHDLERSFESPGFGALQPAKPVYNEYGRKIINR